MARYKDGSNNPDKRREKAPEQETLKKIRKNRCLACKNGRTILGQCVGCKGTGYIK